MKEKDLFNQYKGIKSALDITHKGYDLSKVISYDLISTVYGNRIFLLKDFIQIFFAKKILFTPQLSHILFSLGPYARNEHYEILNYARKGVGGDFCDLNSAKLSFFFSIRNSINPIRKIFFSNDIKVKLPIKSKLSIALKLTHYCNTIDYLEQNNHQFTYLKFCSFCSALPYEAVLDQYFNKRMTTTYTLQHGLNFLYNNPPIDVINYENMISDRYLCWGEATKDDFIRYGIPEEKLIVTGYPRKIKPLKPYIVGNRIKLLVLCARRRYDTNNKAMLKVIQEYIETVNSNASVSIKTHPSLEQNEYRELAERSAFEMIEGKTIQQLFENGSYDFAISYNSTSYFDAYINNCISLHYNDADRENNVSVLDDSFDSKENLAIVLERLSKASNKNETWETIQQRLNYIVGYGINNYSDILTVK